ncbi:mucin-5AC isoform X2 [Odontomachus brunneus]|uniref:mucin-5AC isoform X2 n=1 Tax=Odontomachus brunneus TaxID=486640 RepID=UPI0013F20730|nr:mucin-5AC isoform X2 [Odontomachus brunneus]
MGKPLHWIVILQLSSTFAYTYDTWYRGDTKRPVDVITDVINDLGVKILQQYSNHGNVAFSPTGVAFVLAALYEGSAGRGSQQIVDAVGLPANRDVTRIGFRDIHRRLRSYLNADGFLGGLTLSRENTRLRPEYEDILRFYGFDLSSIEQEANVTVSVEDTSATTELPTSTVDLTSLPVETTSTGSATDTAMLTTNATTLFSTAAETTIAPSTAAAAATQQTVTTPMAADVPTTSAPASTSGPVPQNTPALPASSLTTVTSGESAQPAPSTGVENVAGQPPSMATTPMDSQTSSSTASMIVVAGNQNPQMPTAAGDTATNEATTESNVGDTSTNTPAVPNTSIRVPTGVGTTILTGSDTEVPSTFAANTEMPVVTNATSPNSSAVETSTETTAAASTIVVNTVTGEISNTAISNSPAPVTPITPATIPNPASGTMMDNSIVPQRNTEPSMTPGIPLGETSGTGITIDLTTASMTDGTLAPVSPAGPETTTVISPVPAANGTSDDLAGNSNNFTIAAAAAIDNQTVASLVVDENTIAMSRKKKSIRTELESEMRDVTNDNTVKDESTSNEPAELRKRRTRSPRGYFSSYPDEGIWMQDLDIWKSYSTMSPRESSEDSTSEIAFLVNGCDIYSVSGSRYIAVLPFAYFPSLHAVALEFPLDDPRYNIILLMPTDRTDTHRLARDLSGKSLRSLRKRLQPTWVRATIPSFMLRGFVTLTSFLQRLGILDVFEPRVADLSPMTADLGVYARDVQQSIGVNIRNYMKPDRTHSRNGLFERAGPVPFTAMHPFLYFIVDTETSVSLIAGRVDDPLNSRIL